MEFASMAISLCFSHLVRVLGCNCLCCLFMYIMHSASCLFLSFAHSLWIGWCLSTGSLSLWNYNRVKVFICYNLFKLIFTENLLCIRHYAIYCGGTIKIFKIVPKSSQLQHSNHVLFFKLLIFICKHLYFLTWFFFYSYLLFHMKGYLLSYLFLFQVGQWLLQGPQVESLSICFVYFFFLSSLTVLRKTTI